MTTADEFARRPDPKDEAVELHVRLLGEFSVSLHSERIDTLNTPRLQALLAYLLLHRGAPQPRRQIAFLFWPDSSEEQAQSNLRTLLVALRRAIPDSGRYFVVERNHVQWLESSLYSLDVAEFQQALARADRSQETTAVKQPVEGSVAPVVDRAERTLATLQAAIDLYAGGLLPSCFDEWILYPREQLRQGFLDALAAMIDALEKEGDIDAAILYAQRLLRYDPLQEENYRRLMSLHLANRDRAGMISAYRRCERMLRRELGVEPSDATRDLLRRAEDRSAFSGGEPRARDTKRRGVPHIAGNLPAQTSTFVGREREVVEILRYLRQGGSRLVTLTGTAGIGKTRLAIQAASGLRHYRDGVFFISLAALTEPVMVEQAIAQALGVAVVAGQPLRSSLLDFLREKHILLVLDNFEHLLPAASLVAQLLAECPQLSVLATSRAPLNLRGEREYQVPSMPVPGRDTPHDPDGLAQYEAVALFMERALEVSPRFTITRENASALIEICRRLEGLPLAIELAAVRVKVLSPQAILSRLDHRLKLLVGGKSDLPLRQRALETAIAWSYNLLDPHEKALIRGLSVFAGGWSLEAAENVLRQEEAGGVSILEGITSLLNKSLLVRVNTQSAGDGSDSEGEPRFSMLETIREYARERLRESGEEEALERAHALYFMALAEEAEPHLLRGPRQGEWMDRLEVEHDNVRAALIWARAKAMQSGGLAEEAAAEASEVGLRIVGGIWRLWLARGYQSEGKAHVSQTVATMRSLTSAYTGQPQGVSRSKNWQVYLAKVLYAGGNFAFHEDDYYSARSYHEQSLALRQEVNDKEGIGYSLNSLGMVAEALGDYSGASSLCEAALAVRREIDDKHGIVHSLQAVGRIALVRGNHSEARLCLDESLRLGREIDERWGVAWAFHWLGFIAEFEEDYAPARSLYQQSIGIWQEIGYKLAHAYTISCMGSVSSSEGDFATACSLYKESLAIRRELGDRYGISVCIIGLGEVAVRTAVDSQQQPDSSWDSEQLERGVQLLGAGEALLNSIGASLGANERRVFERGVTIARELLDEAAFAKAWAEGQGMSVAQAVELAQDIL